MDRSGGGNGDGCGRHQRGAHIADRRRARRRRAAAAPPRHAPDRWSRWTLGDRGSAEVDVEFFPVFFGYVSNAAGRPGRPRPGSGIPRRLAVVQAVVELSAVATDACELTLRPDAAPHPVVGGPASTPCSTWPAPPLDELAEELLWHATRDGVSARVLALIGAHPARPRRTAVRPSSSSRPETAAVPQHGPAMMISDRRPDDPLAGTASVRRSPDPPPGAALRCRTMGGSEAAPPIMRRIRPDRSCGSIAHAATRPTAARSRLSASATASGAMGAGSRVSPIRNSSTAAAHERPSAIAHTMRLWPRPMSPQTNTFGEVRAEARRRAPRCRAR